MLKILLTGVFGGMGTMLLETITAAPECEVVAGYDLKETTELSFPVYSDLSKCKESIDVIIDFSHFKAFPSVFKFAKENKLPIVIATTGLSKEDEVAIIEAAKEIPIFRTANMSLGINLLAKALKSMTPSLEEGFDIEIIEKHHHKKVDAPSGTALLLAEVINDTLENKKELSFGRYGREAKRKENEMGIHAIRGGTIPGEHSIIFAGNDEVIEIKHSALSKKVFSEGALKAAKYIKKKSKGLYDMGMLIDDRFDESRG